MSEVNYFTEFLMEKWAGDNDRESACKDFWKKIREYRIATHSTVKKWFGIGGSGRPAREQVFQLALVLPLSPEELEEYLQKGLRMQGVQINDYRELIYYYGAERHLSIDECEGMTEVFEQEMDKDTVPVQHTETEEMWESYKQWKTLEPPEFLHTLCRNAGMFKGYSRTVLDYFIKYRGLILKYVRQEAEKQLKSVLLQTGFYTWADDNGIDRKEYQKEIRHFVMNERRRKYPDVSAEEQQEILNLHWVVYSDDKNTELLSELYASALKPFGKGKGKKIHFRPEAAGKGSVPLMSATYLSNLLQIGLQKERQMRLSQAAAKLRAMDGESPCPEWILSLTDSPDGENTPVCGQVLPEVEKLLQKQKKRCPMLRREDLLTLIHYVSQKQYEEKLSDSEHYVRKDAVAVFRQLADATLTACHMAPLNPEYASDRYFLDSYGKTEMFSLSDMLEQAGE